MTKKENVLEKCRINLDKEKVLHSITRGERDKYKERIDKAIEYLKDLKYDTECCKVCDTMSNKALKILKGEDKE